MFEITASVYLILALNERFEYIDMSVTVFIIYFDIFIIYWELLKFLN